MKAHADDRGPAAHSMSRLEVTLTVVAALLGMALSAIEAMVVGTAMPTIIGKLGGAHLYGWVFSAYLLTSTTMIPIYGKLADSLGRKPVFLFGASLFLVGSMLCGLSQSMEQLIVFRAVQGLGAGAILPTTFTIFGDLFSIEERARMQGLLSAVWGVSSILGPGLGGFITDNLDWRWVFYVNLPFGLLAMALLVAFFREWVERARHAVDYRGTLMLSGGVVLLLVALLEGGNAWSWGSPETGLLLGSSVLLLVLFVRNEFRVPEPMLPPALFGTRLMAVASVAAFVSFGAMFGVTAFVPPFIQGVLNGTATAAGAVLAPMSVCWTFTSVLGGRLILRRGYRTVALLGVSLLAIGSAGLLTLRAGSSPAVAVGAMAVIGAGMGFSSTSLMIAVQNAVAWGQRGIATAANQFFRTIGGSIAVAAMGAVLNARWQGQVAALGVGGVNLADANVLLDVAARGALPAEVLTALQGALAGSLQSAYLVALAFAVVGVLATLLFPAGRVEQFAHRSEPVGEAAASLARGDSPAE